MAKKRKELKKQGKDLPQHLIDFIESESWTASKKDGHYKDWPHQYLVRFNVSDLDLFLELVSWTWKEGYDAYYYNRKGRYFNHGEHTYWSMSGYAGTKILNRCKKEDTYHARVARGDELPPQPQSKKSNAKKK